MKTAKSNLLHLAVLLSVYSCQFPKDAADQKTAEQQRREADQQTAEIQERINKLKKAVASSFVTNHYLWIQVPSNVDCKFDSHPWGYPMDKPTESAKAELAAEKNISDPSLFDGSSEFMLCVKKRGY